MGLFDFLKSDVKKTDEIFTANKRGEGFRIFSVKREDVFRVVQSRRARIGFATAIATIAVYLVAAHLNHENAFLLLGVLAVGALVVYDIVSRRGWERTVTDQLQTLTRNHDRLVRETARNRGDISVIKEGLADTATTVQSMSRASGPGLSAEARMIEAIITQMAALGQKPRMEIGAATPQATAGDPVDDILQLEVAPPPRVNMPREPEGVRAVRPEKFSDAVVLELIRHSVRHDHLDVFVQPVVSLPQRKLRMYEVFARLRASAGAHVPASRYADIAQREQLLSTIDNLLLLRCLQILRDRRDDESDMPYVLNITSPTLGDTGFMNDLVTFLAQYRMLSTRLIFEMPLSDIEAATPQLVEILDGLSKLGCRFSVDQVRKRRVDINVLKSRHIRFIKLDAGWLLREARQDGGVARVQKLKKQLDRSGLDLVVERIEREDELRELLEFGIDFGQGFLFGKPDLHAVYQSRERKV